MGGGSCAAPDIGTKNQSTRGASPEGPSEGAILPECVPRMGIVPGTMALLVAPRGCGHDWKVKMTAVEPYSIVAYPPRQPAEIERP